MKPDSLHKIFPSLQKNLAIEKLSEITDEHPYFSIAQLYLLQQSKNNLSLQEKQFSKTALFFNNIYWLNLQLNTDENISNDSHEFKNDEEEITENIAEQQDTTDFKPIINFETEVTEDTIAFEPLHTTDYFASLGIKLTDEPVTIDKLGTQMKSFTEWLKSMKKIHAEKVVVPDEQTDKKIQTIAEDSNASTDVITEAMADVLVKQNKTEKALEMYRQLSLINPHKSAYFAAKINHLVTSGKI